MKISYQIKATDRQKSKKRKEPAKRLAIGSIAQRYAELRRLREQVSQVELRLSPQ
jgi:hypothetical protein